MRCEIEPVDRSSDRFDPALDPGSLTLPLKQRKAWSLNVIAPQGAKTAISGMQASRSI